MKKMERLQIIFLFLAGMLVFFSTGLFAEDSAVFEPLYEDFNSYENGTTTIPDWSFSNNRGAPGDIIEVENGKLKVMTSADIGTVVINTRFPVLFTGNRAVFQFTVQVVTNTSGNGMFPGLGTAGGTGTTQIRTDQNGSIISVLDDGPDVSMDMILEEGFSYDFGLIIDLQNESQEIYVKNNDTEEIDHITSGFKTAGHSSIEYIKFWLADWDGESPVGEYYFDNISFEEADTDVLQQFYQKYLVPDEPDEPVDPIEVKIDNLDDVTAWIGDAVVVSADSCYAFAGGSRVNITGDDDIFPVEESGDLLVPAAFIADSLGVELNYDNGQTVTLNSGEDEVIFTINNNQYIVNSEIKYTDASTRLVSDLPFIPLKAVADAFNKTTYWDDQYYVLDDEAISFNPEDVIIKKLITTFGIYVSPDGNDSNTGTVLSPFRTIEKARDFLRTMKAGDGLPVGGMTIYLAGGEYHFDDSLTLIDEDSGTEDSPVVYRSIPGDEVYFTGAFNIDTGAFIPVSDPQILDRLYDSVRDKVLQLDLNAQGLSDYGSVKKANVFLRENADSPRLILDNVLQTTARWPNEGYVKTGTITEGGDTTAVGYLETAPERWSEAEDPWAHGFWQYEWRDHTLPIQDIDIVNKSLIMENTSDGYKQGQHYYVFNLLEEIDQPGEWYLNRDTGILYYYPPEELNDNKLQLSLFDKPIVEMTNTASIYFEGITFEASTHSGIVMNYAKNNRISDNTFRNLGTQAVNVKNASNTYIFDNDIYDIGRGGIYLEGGDRPTLTYGNNHIDNNYITRFSNSVKTYAPAVLLNGVGNYVTHNIIHDGPHEGIGVNGNDQFIEYNELYNLVKETGDSGSIYGGRDWTQQGITVRNNIIHSMAANEEMGLVHAFGIYFDDALSGGVITNNLFFDVDYPVNIHGGRSFTIDSNIVAGSRNSMRLVKYSISSTTELEERYAAMPTDSELWKTKYPNIDTILEDQPTMPKYNLVKNTLNYNTGDMEIQPEVYEYGTVENNVSLEESEDPGFVDPAGNIFKLGAGFDPAQYDFDNFVPIDYDNVGLKITSNRRTMPSLSEFALTSPVNGAFDIEAVEFTMSWTLSLGAAEYRVLIASDADFNNIVFDRRTKNDSIIVSGLEYNCTSYFWKVIASSGSILYPETKEAGNGIFQFTTAESQTVDYTELNDVIAEAEEFLAGKEAGIEPGKYPVDKISDLENAISQAELLIDNAASQDEVEGAVADLKSKIAILNASVITEKVDLGILINDSDNWVKQDGGTLVFQEDVLQFTSSDTKVGAYNQIIPNYKTWKFKAQFSFGTDGSKWDGFGLRASEPLSLGWRAYASYIIIIKDDVIELQNFHDGTNRFVTPTIDNNGIIESGVEYDIELGALDVITGVRLTMKVDGVTVFDVIDEGADTDTGFNKFISDPGYFVIYSGDSISLRAAEAQGEPAEPVITSINPVDITTTVGVEPVLPANVTVVYDDVSTAELPVEWDTIDSSEYAQAGSFTVEGTVQGTELKAIANITVDVLPEEGTFESVYIDFEEFEDGERFLDTYMWTINNDPEKDNNTIEVVDGQLLVKSDNPEGRASIRRRLYGYPEKFTGDKAVFQFTVNVVERTGNESMFPGLGNSTSQGPTHMMIESDGTITSIAASGDQSLNMKLEEGNSYDFGIVVDLVNKSQDIYVRNHSTGEIDSMSSGFQNESYEDIEYFKFWIGATGADEGEFYFDNISFEEATTAAMEQFDLKFNPGGEPLDEDINIKSVLNLQQDEFDELQIVQNWQGDIYSSNDLILGRDKNGCRSDLWIYIPGLVDKLPLNAWIAKASLVLKIKDTSFTQFDRPHGINVYQITDPDQLGRPYYSNRNGSRVGLNFNYRDSRPGKGIPWKNGAGDIRALFQEMDPLESYQAVPEVYEGMKVSDIQLDITEAVRGWTVREEPDQGLYLTIAEQWSAAERMTFFDHNAEAGLKPYLLIDYTLAGEDLTVPEQISDLTIDSTISGQLSFNWANPVQDFSGVRVLRKMGVVPFTPFDGELVYDGNLTSFTDSGTGLDGPAGGNSGLVDGRRYYYSFFSYDSQRNYSNKLWCSSVPGTPARPENLTAVQREAGVVEISWEAVNGASAYRLYRKADGETESVLLAGISENETGRIPTVYQDRNIDDRQYSYYLYALNDNGMGQPVETEITALSTTLLPVEGSDSAVPELLSARALSAGEVELIWKDNSANETAFVLERSMDGKTWDKIRDIAFNVEKYNDLALKPAADYRYRIKAVNSKGESDYSQVIEVTTEDKPAAVRGLDWQVISVGSVKLSWIDAADNNTGYRIEIYADGIKEDEISLNSDADNYHISGLKRGVDYRFKIITVKGLEEAAAETEVIRTDS